MSPLGSFVALLAFYMAYLLMGGYIFNNIECAEELAVKRRVLKLQRELMMLIVEGLERLKDEEAPPDSASTINLLIKQMIENRNYEESNEMYKVCEAWGFFNSFFFGFTSITTIGYGKITPRTQLGRGACLLYSIIGIPINNILISSIARFFINKGSGLFLDN